MIKCKYGKLKREEVSLKTTENIVTGYLQHIGQNIQSSDLSAKLNGIVYMYIVIRAKRQLNEILELTQVLKLYCSLYISIKLYSHENPLNPSYFKLKLRYAKL